MNQSTSATGESLLPATTDIFTTGHLLLIAVLALVVIGGLLWGIRLARRRHAAEVEVRAHNREIVAGSTPEPKPADTWGAGGERRTGTDRRQQAVSADDEPPAPVVAPEVANATTELLFTPIPDATPRNAATNPTTGAAAAAGPVTQLKGLGDKLAARLADNGITTVGQIAALTDDEAAALDARLGPFTGRMARDRWQEQARFLAAGDVKGFEAVFGRL